MCVPWLPQDLMDESCELSLLTEILSVRGKRGNLFLLDIVGSDPLGTIKKTTDLQTDRQRGMEK